MAVFNNSVRKPVIKAEYGTRKKAIHTIRRLRSVTRTKARQVARTMYYRAKYHKYQTPGMRNAMNTFKKFLNSSK